jgi:hypothetical protein
MVGLGGTIGSYLPAAAWYFPLICGSFFRLQSEKMNRCEQSHIDSA